MDVATNSLKHILESGEYDLIAGVPIFDAHDEFDDDGNLVRRFDKAELEEICRRCNKRAQETGDLSPFGPGHTIPHAPETMQPVPWGFFHNYRLGTFGPKNKLAIVADQYVKKTVNENGREVPGKEAVATYPRRSIELWVKDKVIDWVALLRRTPQRDLGLLTYAKTENKARPLTPMTRLYPTPARKTSLRAAVYAGKLYYSMESQMTTDPTMPPDAADPDQALIEKIISALQVQFPDVFKQAAPPPTDAPPGDMPMGDDMPPGGDMPMDSPPVDGDKPDKFGSVPTPTNDFIPGKEKLRMSKESEAIRYARMEKELGELKQYVKKAQDAASRAESEKFVQQLEFEGYVLDRAVEVERFHKMASAERPKYVEHIRRYYKQDGIGSVPVGSFLRTDHAERGTPPDKHRKAVDIATRKGLSYDEALASLNGNGG